MDKRKGIHTTKPKPRERPVSRSLMTIDWTCQYLSNQFTVLLPCKMTHSTVSTQKQTKNTYVDDLTVLAESLKQSKYSTQQP